jgi:hypothetical protein
MLRISIIALSFVVIFACVREPASANITSASVTTSQPSYNGPCPATISFSGTINGTPGTKFTYSWNRFINGAQQVVNVGTVTLSAPSYPVSDSITINASTSGNTFDQLWVHGISGGQSDVYSNEMHFSVTCAVPPTPAPTFKINPGSVILAAPHDAPYNIKQTASGPDCGNHGGSFACAAALSSGYLVLTFCYAGVCAPTSSATAQYFRIYEVDNGKHALVDQVTNNGDGTIATVGVVQPPAGGFGNQCYRIVAVDKNAEYGTNSICLGTGTVGPFTTALHPRIATSHLQSSQYGNVPFRAACGTGSVCVGWQHDQSSVISPSFIPIWWYADNYRAYYLFDLSPVAGKYLISATLKIPIDSGDANCFSGIAQANQDWTGNSSWIGGDFYNPGGSLNNGMDVTSIVRSWMNGNTNYGFVLRGSNENLSAESTSCRTFLDSNAELDIVHS